MDEESKEAPSSFEDALRNLINNYCKENDSNTPDFILAKYVERQLDTLTTLILERDKWYGYIPFASLEDKNLPEPN